MDRAVSAIGGVPLNYVSFGPRRPPETTAELREIFGYNEFGEAEYHPPAEPETEEFPPLAGLPETAEPMHAMAIDYDEAPAPYEAPAYEEPTAPLMMPPPAIAPRRQYRPEPQAEPAQRPAMPSPYNAPAFNIAAAASAQPATRPEPAPPPSRPEGFGLPELWRDRRDAGSPTSAPLVEERALAAMFRMLGNKAHGAAPAGDAEDDHAKQTFNELFRRL